MGICLLMAVAGGTPTASGQGTEAGQAAADSTAGPTELGIRLAPGLARAISRSITKDAFARR